MTLRIPAVLLIAALSSAISSAGELGIGDPAPQLKVKEFVKGDAVKEFEKGKIYVVEFWATWCPPCRATIPHLTKLQKKYKDVTFIGVSVSEQDQAAVAPFVKEMGDKMDYRVAIDLVPDGKDGNEGAMSKNWMSAANQDGIPTAFIIEGGGKIAWIGHPTKLDKPLEKIVAGKFDLKEAALAIKKEKHRAQAIEKLMSEVEKTANSGDAKAVLEKIEKAIADDPEIEEAVAIAKFDLLRSKGGDLEKALAYGKKLVTTTFNEDSEALNEFAWNLCNPEEMKLDPKLAAVALEAAQKANKLAEGKNLAILATLARAHFVSGDLDKAIEVQRRAVTLADSAATARKLKEQLEDYRAAKKKKE